ncbi:MAG: 7TM domain-containing protein [Syntrophorhabdus sp.]
MKRPALVTALALMVLSLFIVTYRIVLLGYPVTPAKPDYVWTFRYDGLIKGTSGETLFLLSLPSEQHDQIILEESINSGSMDFNLLREYDNRIGVWSGSPGPAGEYISYRANMLFHLKKQPPPPRITYPYGLDGEDRKRVEELTAPWRAMSFPGRFQTVLAFLGNRLPEKDRNDARVIMLRDILKRYDEPVKLVIVLAAVNIPARIVEGIELKEGISDKTLVWVEAWTGQRYEHIDPGHMERVSARLKFLPLSIGGMSAIRVSGGEASMKRFELRRNIMSRWRIFFEQISRSDRNLDEWSLFRIPPEFQQTFRILLLVPLGALLIAILRNFVGFQTFGIFMPLLMALAFRSTGLFYGLIIFAAIILIGYTARKFLNKLRLLLIPRMSVLVTLVIFCFVILALLGNKFGIRQVMAVGLLPFVILTMTIERFFIIVEEHGMQKALLTALGSAVVAMITFFIIQWEVLQITFFVYPELLLFIMGLQILIGRYTGYRLSELIRFRSFRGNS